MIMFYLTFKYEGHDHELTRDRKKSLYHQSL